MTDPKADTAAAEDYPMTAEELGQNAADRPFDGEWLKQRKALNWAILGVVAAISVMFYFITMIRIEQGAEARQAREAAEAAAAQANAAIIQAITPGSSASSVDSE